jgi:uncharacterized protein (TIGR02284 family)
LAHALRNPGKNHPTLSRPRPFLAGQDSVTRLKIMSTIAHTTEEIRGSTVENFNRLIGICKDGEAGYHFAADEVTDLELKALFTRLARQRGEYAADLQLAVKRLGGAPRDSTTLAGSLHRGWAGLRAVLSTNEAHALLAECERAEDMAVAAYREVLADTPLESEHRLMVSTQAAGIQAAHDEVRGLRDHPAYARKR